MFHRVVSVQVIRVSPVAVCSVTLEPTWIGWLFNFGALKLEARRAGNGRWYEHTAWGEPVSRSVCKQLDAAVAAHIE